VVDLSERERAGDGEVRGEAAAATADRRGRVAPAADNALFDPEGEATAARQG
jgi:hypothetical protein